MQLPECAVRAADAVEPMRATLAGYSDPVPVWSRNGLCAGQVFAGPALVTEAMATTWLPAGWRCRVDAVGNLLLERDDIQTDVQQRRPRRDLESLSI